ncbi:pyruvate dehydrogenase (acetyl-transferring) E1 component subunit alpha [soil metagenome]
MLEIRGFEEEVRRLRLGGEIVGSVHLCIGQEAIPVGAVGALDLSRDVIGSTYRGHGWALATGLPLRTAFSELLGRATGSNGGRGGSAYLSALDHGFLGENSIVGGGVPIACGAALAGRYDGSNRVAMTAFGDGAMNQGALLESLNFAAALALPVVFVCENNLWSELTPLSAMVVDPVLANRAAAFGMRASRIDGNDPHAVRVAAQEAVEHARGGAGPVFIEAMTERIAGHYIGDPETYRTPADHERLAAQDPLPRERARLAAAGVAPEVLEALESEVTAEVQEASVAALAEPLADPSTAEEHVYA